MQNESPEYKFVDLYEMLYWLRIYWRPRGRGHITTVLAESAGINPKTFKRRLDKTKYIPDIKFWRKHGEVSDRDWIHNMKSAKVIFKDSHSLPKDILENIIGDLPKNIRKIHPHFLMFTFTIIGFQRGFAQNNIACPPPPLLEAATDFVVTTIIHISEVIFALINKDCHKYDKSVNQLQLQLPFTFPKGQIWEESVSETKVEKTYTSYTCFFKELFLLGILCLDMAFVTWALTEPKSCYTEGQSNLIEAFKKLSEDEKISFRKFFFLTMKKEVLQTQADKLKAFSNKKFYLALADFANNVHRTEEEKEATIDAIKKQCSRIQKGEYPTPNDLDDFLTKCFSILAKNKPDYDEEAIRFHLYCYRNLFALYSMIDEVRRAYISPETDTSYSILLSKLINYRAWLCKEIFHCPVPAEN